MPNREIDKFDKTIPQAKATAKTAKQHTLLSSVGYVIGSVALFTAACAVIPPLMSNISGALYKASCKGFKDVDDDDWGPVVERKDSAKTDDSEEIDQEDGGYGT